MNKLLHQQLQEHAIDNALRIARRPPDRHDGPPRRVPDRLIGAGNDHAEDHARADLTPETIRLKAQAIAAKEREARQERATGGQVEHALQVARRAAHSPDADVIASSIPPSLRRLAAQHERLPFAGGGDADESAAPVDLGAVGDAIGSIFNGGDQRTGASDTPAASIGDGVGDFFDRWQKNPLSQFLFATGLGAMASDRVNPLQAIGEGAVHAIPYMQSVREYADEEKQKQADTEFIRRLTTQTPMRYSPEAPETEAPEAPASKTPTVPAAPKITREEPKPAINAPSVTPDAPSPIGNGSKEPKPTRTAENAPSPEATPAPIRQPASPTGQIDRQISDLQRQHNALSNLAMTAGSARQRQAAATKLAEIKFDIQNLREERNRLERQATERRGTIGIIGQDAFGNPVRGYTSGPNIGKPLTIQNPTDQTDGIPPVQLSGDALLERLPPQQQAYIRGVAVGDIEPPKGPRGQQVIALVRKFDPNFSTDLFNQRRAMRRGYEPQGKIGQQLSSASAALQHAEQLLETHDRLKNTAWKILNFGKNEASKLKEIRRWLILNLTGTPLSVRLNAI